MTSRGRVLLYGIYRLRCQRTLRDTAKKTLALLGIAGQIQYVNETGFQNMTVKRRVRTSEREKKVEQADEE